RSPSPPPSAACRCRDARCVASVASRRGAGRTASMQDIAARIEQEVGSWEGVTVHPHRFGGVEFRLGRRELGHIHTTWADLPFTTRIREMLLETGRAEPHRAGVRGWVSVPFENDP